MEVVLVSNYLNPHMIPLCTALNNNSKVERFKFIALTEQSETRKDMGFADGNLSFPYVHRAYVDSDAFKRALQITEEADIAIIGEALDEFVHIRMKNNKLTFLSSERFYKLGLCRRFVPSSYKKKKNRFLQYKKKNLYYLTIGAYLPYELNLIGYPIEKCFQWAYFPQIQKLQREKNNVAQQINLLWVGRMLHVKHPEIAVRIAVKLKEKGIRFFLKMIGDGPVLPRIKGMVEKRGLMDCVQILGNCTPSCVQKQMVKNDIFLFTSDFGEGWGAVLSEAMSQGCIPVASYKAGASEILIKNGQNGFIYHTMKQAVQAIDEIYENSEKHSRLSVQAQKTMENVWTAQLAADRFIVAADCLLTGKDIPQYKDTEPMGRVIVRKAKNYITTNF